jgi:hypothetical protein
MAQIVGVTHSQIFLSGKGFPYLLQLTPCPQTRSVWITTMNGGVLARSSPERMDGERKAVTARTAVSVMANPVRKWYESFMGMCVEYVCTYIIT